MLAAQIVYSFYLRMLAVPLISILFLVKWKRSRILTNARLCGIAPTPLFFLRFYQSATLDLLMLLHGKYVRPFQIRTRDESKIQALRSGPGLFLSAHFHNWELMGSWLTTQQGIPLLSAALPLKHPASQLGLEWIRKRTRVPVVSQAISRAALRHLKSGKSFGMLWDQYAPRGEIVATLFGQSLRMDPLPSFLRLKTGAPVFFGMLLPGGHFRIVQISTGDRNLSRASSDRNLSHSSTLNSDSDQGSLDLSQGSSDSNQASSLRLARRYHRVLEILIRAYPWCWYGFAHRRFKDQVAYEIDGSVSRETPSRVSVLVSRETNFAP